MHQAKNRSICALFPRGLPLVRQLGLERARLASVSDVQHLQTPQEALAAQCVDAVQRSVGFDLDGTQDTLPLLDAYVERLRETEDAVLELSVALLGAYLGETLRTELPGLDWTAHEAEEDPLSGELALPAELLRFSPFGLAADIITEGDAEQLEALGVAPTLRVRDSLRAEALQWFEAQADVEPGDYYRASFRFDVIDGLVAFLRRVSGETPALPAADAKATH